MNRNTEQFLVPLRDAERGVELHLSALAGQSSVTRNLNRRTMRQFVDNLCESLPQSGQQLVLGEARLTAWMIRDCQGRTRGYAIQRLGVIRRYLHTLRNEKLLKIKSLSELGVCGVGMSLGHLVSGLQAADPETALAALLRVSSPPGPLAAHVESYLRLHQSLGKQYRTNRYDLWHFNRFVQQRGVSALHEVTSQIIQQWIEPMTCIAIVRARKPRLLHRFFEYLVGVGALKTNPVSKPLLDSYRRQSAAATPFIFTQEQIKAILIETRQLPRTGFFPLRPEACYMMIALLYGLGLRCGEVRRLQIHDLDLVQQTLLIRETKFYKSRYVPFGPNLKGRLEEFLNVRRQHLSPMRADDPLFVTLWRAPIHDNTIREPFTQILRSLGIDGGRERRMPRLHDLRHSFAVHRLSRWYREGIDVQSRLSLLSTFLGHTDVKNTQVYLTITNELLQQASARFFQHFGHPFDEDTLT